MPGNMWLARCSYVAKLIKPTQFSEAVDGFFAHRHTHEFKYCYGKGRYSQEKWILSHPDGQPCDLNANSTYKFGYSPMPDADFPRDLQPAPRFPLGTYGKKLVLKHKKRKRQCKTVGDHINERLSEYEIIYKMRPNNAWWGWSTFGVPYTTPPENSSNF